MLKEDMSFRFFLSTALDCSACVQLKRSTDGRPSPEQKLKDGIESKGAFFEDVVSQSRLRAYSGSEYGPSFDSFINANVHSWFPTFFFMTNDTFRDIKDGKLTPSEAASETYVFNAKYDDNRKTFVMEDQQRPISIDGVISWFVKTSGEVIPKQKPVPPIKKAIAPPPQKQQQSTPFSFGQSSMGSFSMSSPPPEIVDVGQVAACRKFGYGFSEKPVRR